MIDPRIDAATVSKLTLLIVEIVREQCPINHGGILKQLPTNVESASLTNLLKKLRDYGIVRMERKGFGKFMWVYLPPPVGATVKAFRDVGTGKKRTSDGSKTAHVLRDMGLYRVRTKDGTQYERMAFKRATLTWQDKRQTLAMHEITHVAFIPDHAAFKCGVRHLDIYAYPFVDVNDCIIPKPKAVEEDSPKWVHPIRARLLGTPTPAKIPNASLDQWDKDFGDPTR